MCVNIDNIISFSNTNFTVLRIVTQNYSDTNKFLIIETKCTNNQIIKICFFLKKDYL